jgi:hypothetical protein
MFEKKRDGRGHHIEIYQSRNGRIYYRDVKTHQVIWLSPPSAGITVLPREAERVRAYQGFNGRRDGLRFGGYGA